jgi:PAS domain S-box-containing protein
MWGILRDITGRKKAEEALRKSEEKFRNLFDNANDAMVYLDGSGRILDVNIRTVEVFGGKREELIGKQFTEIGLFSFKETPELMRNLASILAGNTANLYLTIKNKKGQQIDLECSASLMKSDESTSIVVVVRDISERKKAEQRIKESEERFRQVSDNAQEWIWEVDSNGLYTFASPVVTKILGYRPEEIVGKKHFYDLFVPEERKVLKKAALQVFAQKQPFTRLVNSNLHKNGNTVVLETSGTPILDSQGMLLGYRGVDTDITERKNAEKSLRESENKFKALFEKAGEGLVYLDLKGKIVDVNQRATEIAGIERDKLMGRSFMKLGLVSLRDMPMLLGRLKDRLKGDTSQLFELAIRRKNGEKRSIEASSTTVQKNNRPIGYLAIVRDVTERKKAEQSIVESHQKFAALFSGNPEATVYADPDMHILDVNPRFIKLFGYSLEEVKGKRLDDIVVPESLVEEGKMLGEKAAKGLVYHDTFRMKKDGSLVPVSVSAAPISIQGHLAGYIATYKDISELKKTEKELKETLRRLEVMNEKLLVVGGLTRHDARNKLTAIIGNTYLVKKKVPEDSAVSEYLKEIETSVKQTTAIFEFAKTYESLGVEDLKYIDVEKTIDEAVTLMPDLKGVRVINQCGGLTVLADSLLRQLFYNLIDNSLKYGEKIRQIKASYEETSQGQLKLVYEDDGVGIQFDAKPKLFSRGYTTGKGSGYGLYLIKKMMEVYGWTIEEKGKPGEGARFVIKMPKTSESGKTGYALR